MNESMNDRDPMKEASDRRLALTPNFAPMIPGTARRLPPKSRRHSVRHRAHR